MGKGKRLFCTACLLIFLCSSAGCADKFDASGYVSAVLDLQFQGDPLQAMGYVSDAKKSSLMEIYQQFIDSFVSSYLTGGMEVTDSQSKEFGELVSRIFSVMHYETGDGKKTGKGTYEVPVTIEPVDTFLRYQDLLTEDSIRIRNQVKAGNYSGSEEEIQEQVMKEIADNSLELLSMALEGTTYGKKQTVILHVNRGQDGEYLIDGEDMDGLIRRILCLEGS